MLSVVTWYWPPPPGYRSKFRAQHVNVLCSMVKRHYPHPHEFCCVTNYPQGLTADVRIIPDRADFAQLTSPNGGHNPSCYRRLRAFSPEALVDFGPRFVSLDLDTVIVGDLTPLWDRPEDFVIWGETNPKSFYNGSMWLLRAGTRTKVWDTFDPTRSPMLAYRAGKFGSDQGWLSYCLGQGEAIWTTADGVYSYNVHLKHNGGALPDNARIVMFHGSTDPDSPEAQRLKWVKQHWH